jgi:hypothetical protein
MPFATCRGRSRAFRTELGLRLIDDAATRLVQFTRTIRLELKVYYWGRTQLCSSFQMPHYTFVLRDGSHTISDDEGAILATKHDAFEYVCGVARELMAGREKQTRNWRGISCLFVATSRDFPLTQSVVCCKSFVATSRDFPLTQSVVCCSSQSEFRSPLRTLEETYKFHRVASVAIAIVATSRVFRLRNR